MLNSHSHRRCSSFPSNKKKEEALTSIQDPNFPDLGFPIRHCVEFSFYPIRFCFYFVNFQSTLESSKQEKNDENKVRANIQDTNMVLFFF